MPQHTHHAPKNQIPAADRFRSAQFPRVAHDEPAGISLFLERLAHADADCAISVTTLNRLWHECEMDDIEPSAEQNATNTGSLTWHPASFCRLAEGLGALLVRHPSMALAIEHIAFRIGLGTRREPAASAESGFGVFGRPWHDEPLTLSPSPTQTGAWVLDGVAVNPGPTSTPMLLPVTFTDHSATKSSEERSAWLLVKPPETCRAATEGDAPLVGTVTRWQFKSLAIEGTQLVATWSTGDPTFRNGGSEFLALWWCFVASGMASQIMANTPMGPAGSGANFEWEREWFAARTLADLALVRTPLQNDGAEPLATAISDLTRMAADKTRHTAIWILNQVQETTTAWQKGTRTLMASSDWLRTWVPSFSPQGPFFANLPIPNAKPEVETPIRSAATPAPSEPDLAKGPLTGVRILDFTRLYPGPLATMLMAEMGADVIKLEDPARPDHMRQYPPFVGDQAAGHLAVNRSKRSLAIDTGNERGQAVIRRLLPEFDVFIEGFKPGVMAAMGLDFENTSAINPRLIQVSVTGFGHTGPYRDKAGHDLNYIGYSGLLDGNRDGNGTPILPGAQVADVAGGAYMAVIGTLAALRARDAGGKGQHVDVAMLDGVLPLLSLQLAHMQAATGGEQRPVDLLSGGLPAYGVYRCKDDKWIALGMLEPKFWKRFCGCVGKPDWVGRHFEMGIAGKGLREELSALFATRTRDAWVALTEEANACLSPILTSSELAADAQLQARGMLPEPSPPKGLRFFGAGIPLKFSGTPGTMRGPAPELGADTEAVLRDLGMNPEEIESLKRDKVIWTV
ncbi:CoA transferase [Sulfidibacter corallicola]|uniref:CoA transferase n=1 Tax=Sulfidibacter corallicola TaxID=2818388 RepID=A0A8A4TIW7_SULCO|nr:CaiB/BaiF CoA-transferase family protein [Sulfidibacter corallicola]QTD49969.1 CoA transferase [Sulfidibacter corallicola]